LQLTFATRETREFRLRPINRHCRRFIDYPLYLRQRETGMMNGKLAGDQRLNGNSDLRVRETLAFSRGREKRDLA